MREVKFRAWHKIAKKMIRIEMIDFVLYAYRGVALDGKMSGSGHLKDIELMEWTGLQDKDGKDIYEGDIVIWDGGQYAIAFSKTEGAWILKDDREEWECPSLAGVSSPQQTRISVIGNIYEMESCTQDE